ncbi:MAG: polysaccharide deacetylase family protein [Cystobacterineae bacterium]|nr:polysaccharide deacetylase family protein [Cystobacterineae bacterium]
MYSRTYRGGVRLLYIFLGLVLWVGCKTIQRALPEAFPLGVVVLSFDDGPNAHEDTTLRLLEVLERHGIRGCFSLLGINAKRHPTLVQRIEAGGHRIINHGYGETWAILLGEEAFEENLLLGKEAIEGALGAGKGVPLAYRPHGGFYTGGQQKQWEGQGYKLAPSSIRIYDAVLSGVDREKAIMRVVEGVEKQGGGIVLLHDSRDAYSTMEAQLGRSPEGAFNRSWVPEAVEEIIVRLQQKGFHLSGVDPFLVPGVIQ